MKSSSGETLYLYLAVSESAVSGALTHEDEGVQKPVYYVSHFMNGPPSRYQRLEKLVLALLIISRKLKRYFQTFPVTVLLEHPLRSIVKNSVSNQEDIKMGIEAEVIRTHVRTENNN